MYLKDIYYHIFIILNIVIVPNSFSEYQLYFWNSEYQLLRLPLVGRKTFSVQNDFHGKQFTMENTIPKLVFHCLFPCKKNNKKRRK